MQQENRMLMTVNTFYKVLLENRRARTEGRSLIYSKRELAHIQGLAIEACHDFAHSLTEKADEVIEILNEIKNISDADD